MWKALLGLLFIAPAYSQVFTEDISKINHFIAEEELERVFREEDAKIEAVYFDSLMKHRYFDPLTGCEEDTSKYKPRHLRYEVIAVTEDLPLDPSTEPKINMVVAKYKFEEEESPVMSSVKKLLANQADTPGKFELKQAQDTGTKIIHFSSPDTVIDVSSSVKAENALAVDIDHKTAKPSPLNATFQVDVLNRLDIKQILSKDTAVKATLQSSHSTGAASLSTLDKMRFNLSKVKAEARLDTNIQGNVKSFAEVNYTENGFEKNVRYNTGFDIKMPDNAEVLVFSGINIRHEGHNGFGPSDKKKEVEFGFTYKSKNGVRFFSRVRNGAEKRDTMYETGLELELK